MTHNGENGWLGGARVEVSDGDALGAVDHYSTGVVCLVVTALAVVVVYPTLVDVTQPLYILSSTAIVILAIATWVWIWFLLEVVVDRRLG